MARGVLLQYAVETDRECPLAVPGGMPDGVRDRGRSADIADFADTFEA
jgi:hypothetical protein